MLHVFLTFRYKGRRPECHAPHVPNQPSEAAAHFYFELAKTVLIKAGGNSSTSIFTQPSASGGHQGPHRNLHLCAFEIGLYALGLHNFVSPNWLSRTYSSHVSWITGELCVCVRECVFTETPSDPHAASFRTSHGDRQCGAQHFGGVLGRSPHPPRGGIPGRPSIASQGPQHGSGGCRAGPELPPPCSRPQSQ